MPQPSDHPDPENPSDPELNPLLNPLLGENMGRWAEAYFTAPPEKRDEAVMELLRQLEAEHSEKPETNNSVSGAERAAGEYSPGFTDTQARMVPCRACGAENAADQRFCGMCGVRLKAATDLAAADGERSSAAAASAPQPAQEIQIEYLPAADLLEDVSAPVRTQEPAGDDYSQKKSAGSPAGNSSVTSWNTDELSLFRSAAGVDHRDEHPDPEGSRFPYRPALGASLALLIAALAYVAWRGTQGTAANAVPSSRAPSETTQPLPSPPPATETGKSSSAAVADPAVETPQISPKETADPSPAPSAHTTGGGAEELAQARKYLASPGSRDQAIEWLWKAVALRNTEATLVLSDLYLKGDGIAKNCEQARVLLDAAAARDVKAAGDRLRHLAAFGCQ